MDSLFFLSLYFMVAFDDIVFYGCSQEKKSKYMETGKKGNLETSYILFIFCPDQKSKKYITKHENFF